MRIVMSLIIMVLIGTSAPRLAQAEQANSCKQCSDQRHACTEAIPQKPVRSNTSGA